MTPQFFWIGVLGLVAIAACWALAVVLYRVGTPGSMARKLALLLFIEGFVLFTAGYPESALGMDQVSFGGDYLVLGIASYILHHLADAGMLIFYPPFLAAALQTKLTRPFGRKRVRIVVIVVSIALALGTVVSAVLDSAVGMVLLYVCVMLMFGFALVSSIHAWLTAEPGLTKTRAGLFAVAFGIRDICWGFMYGLVFWMILTDTFPENLFWFGKIVNALGTLLAVPLIAYGILRAHLFDIDLKIRWTIKQSTLAGLIVAIIFLISEGASEFLSAELGTVAGLLAAAVIIFFLAPLQRFAERVAASAMPNTENTPEYVAFRKMQVYEAALIEALEEGDISAKERSLLVRLHESLGITTTDAETIESDVRARLSRTEKYDAVPV